MLLLLFSHAVVSDYFQPHGLQHTRSLCPSPSPKVCLSSHPLHWWCHPSSRLILWRPLLWPQSFPASGTFPMGQLFPSDVQNTGVSASASVLPRSIQGWFPLRLTSLISLLQHYHYSLKASVLWRSAFSMVQLSHPYLTTGNNIALTI